jgi:DNA-binding MarR family transcriptional regulator
VPARSPKTSAKSAKRFRYPAEQSIGHQVRWAHRALQRELEEQIRPYGITLGMWYFLRALWEEDGLSQRELSDVVGTAEPTTVAALHAMEKRGLVTRVANTNDRRKSNIYLTRQALKLRELLLPQAREVNRLAGAGISAADVKALKRILTKLRANLAAAQEKRVKSRAATP